MNFEDKETLSQLMDGEWQDLNSSQSVEHACASDELKATWSRYHLIRDVIRQDAVSVDESLCARISQAIEDEPTYSNVTAINAQPAEQASAQSGWSQEATSEHAAGAANVQKKSNSWGLGLGGLALAACVALATVVGLNVWRGAPTSGVGVQSVASSGAAGQAAVPVVLPEVEYVSNTGTYWVTQEAERNQKTEQRLNMLLSTHIERSPTAERTGMLPYSRLVGYDSVPVEQ